MWPSSGVVSGSPSSSSQNSSPRFLGMKRWLVHPIIRSDMNQVQMCKLFGKILKRHPVINHFISILYRHCKSPKNRFRSLYQNSPSLRTRTDKSSLSRSDNESHSQERSDQGPLHSPRPQGFLRRTSGTSPRLLLLTRANPVTL